MESDLHPSPPVSFPEPHILLSTTPHLDSGPSQARPVLTRIRTAASYGAPATPTFAAWPSVLLVDPSESPRPPSVHGTLCHLCLCGYKCTHAHTQTHKNSHGLSVVLKCHRKNSEKTSRKAPWRERKTKKRLRSAARRSALIWKPDILRKAKLQGWRRTGAAGWGAG